MSAPDIHAPLPPEAQRILEALPERLLPWFRENHRDLPWRQDREPYHVWLSEIMLQQTRVEAVKGYYRRFLEALPTIEALAGAPEPRLLKLWEGLGYYSRVRNLQKAAIVIRDTCGGVFPDTWEAVRALPGIGDYTAGAIASICFDAPTPAVDGNVLRVMSRLLDDHSPVDRPAVKRRITELLRSVYPREAGTFTQSLMELGATVCGPNTAPDCSSCPLGDLCLGRSRGTATSLPVKGEKKQRRQEALTVFLLTCGDKLAVSRRPETGLLAGLYELPNLPGALTPAEIIAAAEDWGTAPEYLEKTVSRRHIFTHIQWNMTGARLHCGQESPRFIWADRAEIRTAYALPTAFRQFLPDIWEDEL